jgi:hypothetical protein
MQHPAADSHRIDLGGTKSEALAIDSRPRAGAKRISSPRDYR